ncbi:MAG: hypothetical protein ACYC3I_03535 [Gemmataceae bacterium]
MLTKWFGTQTTRSSKQTLVTRPWLEFLEERNAPSGFKPMGDGHPKQPDRPDHGPPGPPPPAMSSGISSNVNAHGSFNNSTITGSFNNTINNTYILMPTQQASVAGLFSVSLGLASALNSPQLGSLLSDEVALGVDTYLSSLGLAKLIPSLPSDIANLNAAIHANTLGSTALGAAIGSLAFNATLDALTTAQPTI